MAAVFETLVFIHVVAAAIFVGSGGLLLLMGVRALSTSDPAVAEGRARDMVAAGRFAGPRLFVPAALVLIVFGVWAAGDAGLSYGDNAWLWIGIGAWVVGALIAGPVHARNSRALRGSMDAGGWAAGRPLLRRDLAISVVEAAVLVFAVWAMVAKP